jgi:hypothetical protein
VGRVDKSCRGGRADGGESADVADSSAANRLRWLEEEEEEEEEEDEALLLMSAAMESMGAGGWPAMRVVGRARGRQQRRRGQRSTSIAGRSGTTRICGAEEDGKRGPRGERWSAGRS